MRVTQHNSRGSGGRSYMAKHNDRNFDTSKSKNIVTNPFLKSNGQTYWSYYPNMSFEEAEKRFYKEHFCNTISAQNDRYKTSGHSDRCKSIDDYRLSLRTCPEEQILQIGKAGEVDWTMSDTLREVVQEQIDWEQKRFPQCVILDWGLHVDEPEAAPHVHIRRVWIGHDRDGHECVSQTKALQEMGVSLPDPGRPRSRYNNAKQTYTQECRAHLIGLCKSLGLSIEERPLEASEVGLSHAEYKRRQEERKASEALRKASEALSRASEVVSEAQERAQEIRDSVPDFEAQIELMRDRDTLDRIRHERPELFTDKGKYKSRKSEARARHGGSYDHDDPGPGYDYELWR